MRHTLRVAIADDDPLLLSHLRKSLTRFGHDVVSQATTGRELIDQCQVHRPDLVVSDITMPELDGLEAARIINRTRRTPVIFVSAGLDQNALGCAETDYIVACMAKPMKAVELEAAVSRFLHSHEDRTNLSVLDPQGSDESASCQTAAKTTADLIAAQP